MISMLTPAGLAICAALSQPCTGPAGLSVALRPLMPDSSPDWQRRFDMLQSCLDGKPCNLIGGTDCTDVADFRQSDGRTGKTFLCRITNREEPTS